MFPQLPFGFQTNLRLYNATSALKLGDLSVTSYIGEVRNALSSVGLSSTEVFTDLQILRYADSILNISNLSTEIYLNTIKNAESYININNLTLSTFISLAGGIDFDAQAVINAIEATGATLSGTQKDAITNRIVSAKADGVWSKWIAYYGFVGGTAASHAINWKNPATGLYNINWSGSLTHNSLGTKGGGGYGNTGFRSSTVSGLTTIGLSYYTTEDRVDFGQIESECSLSGIALALFDFQQFYGASLGSAVSTFAVRSGFSSGTTWEKNLYSANFVPGLFTFNIGGAAIETTVVAATTTTVPDANLWIFDENRNNAGSIGRSSTARMGSFCINTGLTSAEETANYVSELAFQTDLERN